MADYVFQLKSMSKSYGKTKALKDCSFDVERGEVHAFIGENGAGKSTLLKTISGITKPDSGEIVIDGVSYSSFASPDEARKLGIGTSFQEILIVPTMTVYENIVLGAMVSHKKMSSKNFMRKEAQEIFWELAGQEIPLDTPISELEISKQQLCVISRCMLLNPKVALLDEPTAALDATDSKRLFAMMRRKCKEGTSFIFISHRMDEIMDIANHVTVLRTGESVGTVPKAECTPDILIKMMSGDVEKKKRMPSARTFGDVRLKIKDLKVANETTAPINMDLRAGEVIGIAGLEGSGQGLFVEMLAGIEKPVAGTVTIVTKDGEKQVTSLRQASKDGIAYVPRSRKTNGIFEILPIIDNFAMPAVGRYKQGIFINNKKINEDFRKYFDMLSIRMDKTSSHISTLSGGNQQKVLVARWLNMNPDVIIFNDPTRGVDPKTKHDIYNTIDILAQNGTTVIFLSTDVEELVASVDRVLVFRNQNLEAEIGFDDMTTENIVSAFFGQNGKEDK